MNDSPSSPEKLPSFEDFNSLLVLVEEGSVSKAAKVLSMSQSALSHRLQVFKHAGAEREAVLQSKGPSVVLTPTGERALPAVRDLVRQYDQLINFLFKHAAAPQTVRLGLGTFPAQYYLPRVLARLGAECAERFHLKTELMRGKQRIERVASGHLDLAVVTHERSQIQSIARQQADAELEIECLGHAPFCVIAKKGVPAGRSLAAAAKQQPIQLAWLARWPLVGLDPSSGIRLRLERTLRGIGVELRFVNAAGVGGWDGAKEFVAYDLGVAVVPLLALKAADREQFVVRRLPEEFSFTDSLIHRPELNSAQSEVNQALVAAAKDHRQEVLAAWRDEL